MDASSVSAGRTDRDPSAASTPTDQGDGEDTPAVLSGRAAHELSNWARPPATVRGRTRGQIQRMGGEPGQYRMDPEVRDALLAAAYEWTKSRSLKERTSWNTEDPLVTVAGGPEQTKRGVERVRVEWFPGRRRTAPAVRSRR